MRRRRRHCPNPARAWYERPAEFVRDDVGRLVGAVPRQMVKLCEAHKRKGDAALERVDGGRCGFGFNAPPLGGVFIETAARPRRHRR